MLAAITLLKKPQAIRAMELSNNSNSCAGYTTAELNLIFSMLSDRMCIASKLMLSAGLKASELHTLEKRSNGMYVVHSHDYKTSRRVNVLPSLDAELTMFKRSKPVVQINNKKKFISHFNLPNGQHWNKRFNQIAIQAIGRSHSIKTMRDRFAINRWEHWYKPHTDKHTANALIDLELGSSLASNMHRQWRKDVNDNTYFDYESACEKTISDQTIGALLSGTEINTCFSCANLYFIANHKGIYLSLESILSQSSTMALEAIKCLQWQYDFAKYNFNMVSADSESTAKQKSIAANDLDISCLQLMKKIESTKEYLLEQNKSKNEFNLPFIGNASVCERAY